MLLWFDLILCIVYHPKSNCYTFYSSCLLQCLQNELRKHLPTFLIDPEQYGSLPAGIGAGLVIKLAYIYFTKWTVFGSLTLLNVLFSVFLLQKWCLTPWWTPCLCYAVVRSTMPSPSSSSLSSSTTSASGFSISSWALKPAAQACAPTTGELLSVRGSQPSKPGQRDRAWSWQLTATWATSSRYATLCLNTVNTVALFFLPKLKLSTSKMI